MPYKERHVPHAGVAAIETRLSQLAKHQHILSFYYEKYAKDAYVATGVSPRDSHKVARRILTTHPARTTLDVNLTHHATPRDARIPLAHNTMRRSFAYDARSARAIINQMPATPCTYKASSMDRAEAHAALVALLRDEPVHVIIDEHEGIAVLTDVATPRVKTRYPRARSITRYASQYGYVVKTDVPLDAVE